jgi:hypothetical protein
VLSVLIDQLLFWDLVSIDEPRSTPDRSAPAGPDQPGPVDTATESDGAGRLMR